MALGSTQSLTEIITTNIFPREGVGGILPPSRADCQEVWKPQLPRTFKACPGIVLPFPESNHSRHSFKASSLGWTGQKWIQDFQKLEPESKANKFLSCYFQKGLYTRHQRGAERSQQSKGSGGLSENVSLSWNIFFLCLNFITVVVQLIWMTTDRRASVRLPVTGWRIFWRNSETGSGTNLAFHSVPQGAKASRDFWFYVESRSTMGNA